MRMSLRKKISLATAGSVVLAGFLILGWALLTGRLGGKAVEEPITNIAFMSYQDKTGKTYGPLSSNPAYTKRALIMWALKIALQGAKSSAASTTITVSQAGTTNVVATITVSSDSNGNITVNPSGLGDITAGATYDIRIKVNGYLVRKVTTVLPPDTTINVGQLLAGDFNGDNKVFLDDISVWLGSYKKTASAGNILDVNQDGKVFLDDLSIFLVNYKKIGG